MSFPDHIEAVLDQWGIAGDTKAALFDLYVSMGNEVLEVFSDIAEAVPDVASLTPENTLSIRQRVVERYLQRSHPLWLEGKPTPSLWHPRVAEGRAAGLAVPLGSPVEIARRVVGADQPVSDGILMLGRNAHYGGREQTISFDVVASDPGDAIAIGKAVGQQHTLPGSVGETSGTFDATLNIALIWEVQPNVYKPAGDRNREISKVYRRHRNWHLVTLACAIDWLRSKGTDTFILRGDALATTHEVNPERPVSEMIVSLHDRTVQQVVDALGLKLEPAPADALDDSIVMNHALGQHVAQHGAAEAIWRVVERNARPALSVGP